MPLPPEITTPRDSHHGSKVGDIIRRLSSVNEGELVACVHALWRVLESAGADFHALAEHLENPNGKSLTEGDLKKIFDNGYAAGVREAQARHYGVDDFLNTDGKPNWDSIALFLQRNKNRLDPRHHQFVDDMASRTVYGHEPTEKQHKYLHSLFYKLGGKIT